MDIFKCFFCSGWIASYELESVLVCSCVGFVFGWISSGRRWVWVSLESYLEGVGCDVG